MTRKNVVQVLVLFFLTAVMCFAQSSPDQAVQILYQKILSMVSAVAGIVIIIVILRAGIEGGRILSSLIVGGVAVYLITHADVIVTWIRGL